LPGRLTTITGGPAIFAIVVGIHASPSFAPMDVTVPLWGIVLMSLLASTFSCDGRSDRKSERKQLGGLAPRGHRAHHGVDAGPDGLRGNQPSRAPVGRLGQPMGVSVGPLVLIVFVLLLFPDGRLHFT
jgi:hypothetical protein